WIRAGVTADHRAGGIEDLELYRAARMSRNDIIEDRAIRRIGGHGFVLRHRGAGKVGWPEAKRRRRREQASPAAGIAGERTQRSDIVENVKSAAMGGDDEIVAMDGDVSNRSRRQPIVKYLPRLAVVERDKSASLGSRKKQA